VWVTVFSPNDISGLGRPKIIKFGTKVVSSTSMMHAHRFLVKVFLIMANLHQKTAKVGQKTPRNEHILLHMLPQNPKTVEMWKLAQT